MANQPKDVSVTFRATAEIVASLRAEAEADGRSVADVLRRRLAAKDTGTGQK